MMTASRSTPGKYGTFLREDAEEVVILTHGTARAVALIWHCEDGWRFGADIRYGGSGGVIYYATTRQHPLLTRRDTLVEARRDIEERVRCLWIYCRKADIRRDLEKIAAAARQLDLFESVSNWYRAPEVHAPRGPARGNLPA